MHDCFDNAHRRFECCSTISSVEGLQTHAVFQRLALGVRPLTYRFPAIYRNVYLSL